MTSMGPCRESEGLVHRYVCPLHHRKLTRTPSPTHAPGNPAAATSGPWAHTLPDRRLTVLTVTNPPRKRPLITTEWGAPTTVGEGAASAQPADGSPAIREVPGAGVERTKDRS